MEGESTFIKKSRLLRKQSFSISSECFIRDFILRDNSFIDSAVSHFGDEKLLTVNSALTTFWPLLQNICEFEKSRFLPDDLSEIVIKLLEIRKNTAQRDPDDYLHWEDPSQEHRYLDFL